MLNIVTDRKESITCMYGNERVSFDYSDELYDKIAALKVRMDACAAKEEWDGLVVELKALTRTTRYLAVGGSIFYDAQSDDYRVGDGTKFLPYHIAKNSHLGKSIDSAGKDVAMLTPIAKLACNFFFNPKPTQARFDMLDKYLSQKYVDEKYMKQLMDEGFTFEVASKKATFFDMQITTNGLLTTYKIVNEVTWKWGYDKDDVKVKLPRYETKRKTNDVTGEESTEVDMPKTLEEYVFTPAIYTRGDKFYSNDQLGYIYKVGELASLRDWKLIDTTDNSEHDRGLHFGGHSYINNYSGQFGHVLEAFICPSKIAKFTRMGIGELTALEGFITGSSTMEVPKAGFYNINSYKPDYTEAIKDTNKKLSDVGEAITLAIEERNVASTILGVSLDIAEESAE